MSFLHTTFNNKFQCPCPYKTHNKIKLQMHFHLLFVLVFWNIYQNEMYGQWYSNQLHVHDQKLPFTIFYQY